MPAEHISNGWAVNTRCGSFDVAVPGGVVIQCPRTDHAATAAMSRNATAPQQAVKLDGVHAVAADGREDVVEHPCLELLGGGQLGGDNQPVQVALADEPDLLDATSRLKGVVFHDPLAVTCQGIFRVGVAEGGGHIPAVEQDLPAGGDGSDRAELVVGERM